MKLPRKAKLSINIKSQKVKKEMNPEQEKLNYKNLISERNDLHQITKNHQTKF